MQIIRDLEHTHQIRNPAIRSLVQQRIQVLSSQGFAVKDVGHFFVVEAADTVASIEWQLGVSIISYEICEELPYCFDLVYVMDQAGRGIEMFVPKEEGIDADLLAWSQNHAFMLPPED